MSTNDGEKKKEYKKAGQRRLQFTEYTVEKSLGNHIVFSEEKLKFKAINKSREEG